MLRRILEKPSWLEEVLNSPLPVAAYGMGNGADKLFSLLEQQGVRPCCVFASDEFVRGQQFRGYPVLRFAQVLERYGKVLVLLAFATDLPEVMARIEAIGRQVPLLCPSFSVVGEEYADRSFLARNQGRIERAYDALADSASQEVLLGVAEFQLTGRLECLRRISSPRRQSLELLRLCREETYADLGAYRGDTVLEFLQLTGGYRRIFAAEPDAKNFARLQELIFRLQLKRVCAKRVAAYRDSRLLNFGSPGGRSSRIGQGKGSVQAMPLLEITNGEIPSYIKMDIEGAEASAIEGMKQVLATHAPKLLVSAYHRIGDYFSLPLRIRGIQPSYQMYLRKSPYYPAWEVNLICTRP